MAGPVQALRQASGSRNAASHPLILRRHVLVGVVTQHRGRDDAEDSTAEDIKGDRKARREGGEQCRCDERRGAASDDRGRIRFRTPNSVGDAVVARRCAN